MTIIGIILIIYFFIYINNLYLVIRIDKEIKDIDDFSNRFTKYNINNVLILENIKDKLRNKLSITAEAPNENIVIPKTIEVKISFFSLKTCFISEYA